MTFEKAAPGLFRYRGLVYVKLNKEVTITDEQKANSVKVTSGELVLLEPNTEIENW